MKTLRVFAPLVLLAACTAQPVEPTGIYRLDTAEKMMVLDVRASGDYVLQIDGPDSMTDEIRGRWEDKRNTDIDVTFHGIAWHGDRPESNRSLWPVKFEANGGFCIDVDNRLCFTKDGQS